MKSYGYCNRCCLKIGEFLEKLTLSMSLVAYRFGRYQFEIWIFFYFLIFQLHLPEEIKNKYSKFDMSKWVSYQGHKSTKTHLFISLLLFMMKGSGLFTELSGANDVKDLYKESLSWAVKSSLSIPEGYFPNVVKSD